MKIDYEKQYRRGAGENKYAWAHCSNSVILDDIEEAQKISNIICQYTNINKYKLSFVDIIDNQKAILADICTLNKNIRITKNGLNIGTIIHELSHDVGNIHKHNSIFKKRQFELLVWFNKNVDKFGLKLINPFVCLENKEFKLNKDDFIAHICYEIDIGRIKNKFDVYSRLKGYKIFSKELYDMLCKYFF